VGWQAGGDRRELDNAWVRAMSMTNGSVQIPTRLRGDVFANEQTLPAPNWQIVAKDKPMKPVACRTRRPRWKSP
jgi:hypothetical protein